MGKRGADPIPDAWLITNGVYELDPALRISPKQVELLTGLSYGQLAEYRRTRPPTPPLALSRDKKGQKIWYRLGDVLSWRRARQPVSAPRRAKSPDTFHSFLTRSLPNDTWPLAQDREGRLVDFFASLRMSDTIDHRADIAWLSLDDFLRKAETWLAKQRTEATARWLSQPEILPKAPSVRLCPRCGRSNKPGHPCRF
jgi:hypothetical protein